MGSGVNRTRNHRRKNCSTCDSITQAHYYLTGEPHSVREKLIKFKEMKVPCEEIDNVFVFIFKDSSLLAYEHEKGFYKVDTFLRKSTRRLA